MNLLVIADPLATFKTYKDSTYAMMREADRRGHRLFALEPEHLLLRDTRVLGMASAVTLKDDSHDWFDAAPRAPVPLAEFDLVLMRKDPPFDNEYLYSTHLLDLAERQGALVVNRPQAIRDFNEKLAVAKFASFAPPTLVTRLESVLREFLAEHRDVIFKPLDGMGGSGVFRVREDDPNIGVIIETITVYGARTIMAQRYLPEIRDGDKRVLLIDGIPAPYALARIPKAGETRGNLAAGGTGVARPLTDRDREIASALGPTLRDLGLTLVGLDVIGSHLTEINVTSPTGMQEIAQQTDCNPAALMIDALERLHAARRSGDRTAPADAAASPSLHR
ncbi:MAG: glutathione synthase [Proteobacteria bacterium]|nr:glutathione synthase [Burkholderiales bacterium]